MAEILIIDDNAMACDALSMVLEASGYVVRCTHRVADAIAEVQESCPDLAIVDLSMPDGNGVDLIHKLHQVEPDLPFILYSGYFTPEDDSERRAKAMDGIVAVFKKPLRNADLLRAIEEALA